MKKKEKPVLLPIEEVTSPEEEANREEVKAEEEKAISAFEETKRTFEDKYIAYLKSPEERVEAGVLIGEAEAKAYKAEEAVKKARTDKQKQKAEALVAEAEEAKAKAEEAVKSAKAFVFRMEEEAVKASYKLSTAFAYSVCKKLNDPNAKLAQKKEEYDLSIKAFKTSCNGFNPGVTQARNTISRDIKKFEAVREVLLNSKLLNVNSSGDITVKKSFTEEEARLNASLLEALKPLGDGSDLVEAGVTALWYYCDLYKEIASRGNGFMDIPFSILSNNNHIRIKEYDPIEARTDKQKEAKARKKARIERVKEEEVTISSLVFKFIRYTIMNSKNGIAGDHPYTYLEALTPEEEEAKPDKLLSEASNKLYYRMEKLSSIDSIAVYEDYYSMLSRLNLTVRQATVLRYREKGYGKKAIATRLEVTPHAISCTFEAIRKKAEKAGISPEAYKRKELEAEAARIGYTPEEYSLMLSFMEEEAKEARTEEEAKAKAEAERIRNTGRSTLQYEVLQARKAVSRDNRNDRYFNSVLSTANTVTIGNITSREAEEAKARKAEEAEEAEAKARKAEAEEAEARLKLEEAEAEEAEARLKLEEARTDKKARLYMLSHDNTEASRKAYREAVTKAKEARTEAKAKARVTFPEEAFTEVTVTIPDGLKKAKEAV